MRRATSALALLGVVLVGSPSWSISRAEIVAGAPAFEEHAWQCGPENLTASCADSSWKPAVTAVGPQVGLPYCWGGWVTIDEFDQQIAAGYGAGSLPAGLFLDCTTGVDCSGYVSQLWQHPHKLGTATIPGVSSAIDTTAMQPGDVFNDANHHVIMFLGKDGNGDAIVTEATNATACLGVCRRTRPFSAFAGYIPRAYFYADLPDVTGEGTLDDPIRIEAFPFRDWRSTMDAKSDGFDYYSAAPTVNESGPEYIYVFQAATGGTLTATVIDGVGVDIDIHLLSGPSADVCLVRDDKEISFEISSPGTYYLVADTYVGSSGTEYTGAYWLDANFTGELVPPEQPEPAPEAGPEAGPEAEPVLDAALPDAPPVGVDAEVDAPAPPGGYASDGSDGCACGVVGQSPRKGLGILLVLFVGGLMLGARTRRRSPKMKRP